MTETLEGDVMLQVSLARLRQGHRTIAYPAQEPMFPDRFRGLPRFLANLNSFLPFRHAF